jgi:hypothetical protein
MGNWTLESIAWDRFDASKVDPEILRNIKAAALVERNGGDYRIYLNRVFADDPAFSAAVDTWANEEVQHGLALGRWAQLADEATPFDEVTAEQLAERERQAERDITDAGNDAEKAAAEKALAVAKDLRRAQAYYASR